MKKNIIIVVLFINLVLFVKLSGDSAFANLGFPIIKSGMDVYSQGMGYSGIADQFRFNNSMYNPALSTTGNKVLLSTGIKFGFSKMEDKGGNSFNSKNFEFSYFNFIIPYKSSRFIFNYFSFLSGKLSKEEDKETIIVFPGDEPEVLNYTQEDDISNYISQMDLGYAFENSILNIGVGTNLYIGHAHKEVKTDFEEESIVSPKYGIDNRFKGFGAMIGFAKKWENIATSFVYHSETKISGDKIYNNVVESETNEDGSNLKIPNRFAWGLSFKFKNIYKINTDIHYDGWENVDSQNSRNTISINAGIAYEPIRGFSEWYKEIPVRMGFFLHQLPFKSDDKNVDEYGFTFGLSLPLKSIYKSIDFAFEYSVRGNLDSNEYEDNEIMFSIGVSSFDIFKSKEKLTAPRIIPKSDQKDWL